MRNTRRFLFFAALISLGVFFIVNFFLTNANEEEKLIKPISKQIQKIENEFNDDYLQLTLKPRPDEDFSFTNLTIDSYHPYYLFTEEGKLVYWSDFSFMPDFDLIIPSIDQRIIENSTGIFFSKIRRYSRNNQGYWIVQLYPLYFKRDFQNQYLESGFNSAIFSNDPGSISSEQEEGMLNVVGAKGETLFSVYFDPDVDTIASSSQLALIVFFFSLFFLILLMTRNLILGLWKKGNQVKAFISAFVVLITIRALMLVFRFPRDYFENKLFDPSGYASSSINPSLGDLFINIIVLAILLGMLLRIISSKGFKNWLKNKKIKQNKYAFLFITYCFSTSLLVLFYGLYIDILSNSQWDLNILSLPSLDWFKIVSLSIVFIGGASYFLLTVMALDLTFYHHAIQKAKANSILFYSSLPLIFILAYFNWIWMVAYCAHLIFLIAVINFKLYNYIFKIGLNSFLTYFFGCLISAIITGVASHQVYLDRNFKSKASFGNELLVENDILAEFFLSDIMQRIRDDLFIKNSLMDPLMRKDPIAQKIRKIHVNNYFDQYALKVSVFNYSGENLLNRNSASGSLEEIENRIVKSDYATSVRDLYFVNKGTVGDGNQYHSFIPLFKEDIFIGTVYLELRQLRVVPGSVFPKLIIDEKYLAGLNDKKFDYAKYEEGELIYGVGLFNYRAANIADILEEPKLYTTGVYRGKLHHVGVKEGDKVIVVSSPVYPIYYILADISLFFIGFLIFTLVGFVMAAVFYKVRSFNVNYATKLQLYLNFAFFFPILIISIIIVGLFTRSYQDELHRQYRQKTALVSDNLSTVIEKRKAGILEKDELAETMNNLAGTANTDINLYSKEGFLLSTSQSNIFDKKVLTKFINPRAIVELVEGQNNLVLLEEKIGNLTFKSVYAAIRSKDGQAVEAIVAVPFFESETELDLLIADVLSNIINIFVLVFIVFLFISYFVSKNLTFPFKLLTQKIKATGLDNNEPMFWPTNDEIGLLVNEYNNMLFKLDSSKRELANSEKESAWREMAKQVAHEIKNPLTPMKLTLQHLLRLQIEGKLDDPKKLKQPLETLITQVDTLSDIANSFSNFAKMPQPKKEVMDFKAVVIGTLELFKNRENERIIFGDLTEDERLPVMGDIQLFGRIIANLIINGFQASHPHKKSVILVFLRVVDNQVLLEIKDNGKGIPLELRDIIFKPNFSTKSEGSGLGLAIAKRGVETEGGKIWFETEEDKGTSFFLSFNLLKEIQLQ